MAKGFDPNIPGGSGSYGLDDINEFLWVMLFFIEISIYQLEYWLKTSFSFIYFLIINKIYLIYFDICFFL